VQVVLAEAIAVAFVSVIYLAFLYRPLQRAIMALDEWVVGTARRMLLFVAVLFVLPGILLLSGRIIGVGPSLARGGSGELWLSLVATVLIALPVWAVVDAISRPSRHWEAIGMSKRSWVLAMAATALFGIGFAVALYYMARVRPKLSAAEIVSYVALWGDEALA
jgi:hypothetical protein